VDERSRPALRGAALGAPMAHAPEALPVGPGLVLVGGIPTVRATRSELADQMAADAARARQGELPVPRIVVSSNGSVIAAFHRDPDFRALLLQADLIDADGMPLVMATQIFCREPLKERVATTDFIHDAAAAAVREGLRFYFLGAKPGVAEAAADSLRAQHPGLEVVGIRHGYFGPEEEKTICAEVRASGADVLWVGLGSPRQEDFAVRNRERLAGLAWIRTCGGLFDHCSGQVRRAPRWMQQASLEWLHRAVLEPRRLGWRYIATNPAALFHLVTKTRD
jgi:N-acetylglucosaminyldiphosphoundecaprenol N-acetyl-beta-D-mannosaminyltransferase